NDLMHPFYPDIERATIDCDRFRVIPTARRQRVSVGAEHRRHLRVRNPARPGTLVKKAAAKPPSLVARSDEMRTIRCAPDGRYAAKVVGGRAQHQTPAEFQQPELSTRGIADSNDVMGSLLTSIANGEAAEGDVCAAPATILMTHALATSAAMVRRFGQARPRGFVVRSGHASSLRRGSA